MGLPEIVDFARNFAVMVRVQGPDPKGLKMRRHAFHHYNSGKTTISASGMLLPESLYNASIANEYFRHGGNDQNMALVVTVASIVEPFLSLQHRQKITQALPELIPGAQIDIMFEGKTRLKNGTGELDKQTEHWLPAQILRLVDAPSCSSALQSLIEASSGSRKHDWEVGWSLSSHNKAPQTISDFSQTQNQSFLTAVESSNPNVMANSTTRIAILGVSSLATKVLPNATISTSNNRGNFLLAMGSPFGVLSPMHFFNSGSEGSISNCYPPNSSNRSLLMADVRCLPGMEGGPVFDAQAHLIGLLARPLRQKNSGAEIQLVIPWKTIATAWSDLFLKDPQGNTIHEDSILSEKSPVETAMTSICLITIDDGAWASGVLLNKQGLILTNAHLLEPWRFGKDTLLQKTPKIGDSFLNDEHKGSTFGLNFKSHKSIRIRLDHMDRWIWCDASVVYISRGPLDVALLQVESVPDQLCPIGIDFSCPSPGSKAYVIGHGLFGPRHHFSPSVCCGIVAKVVKANIQSSPQETVSGDIPTMLETTAAVHPGGSGGAVVNSNGQMIGLVTSNARHGGGTVIPHLNFSIPCAALTPIFKFSKDMQVFSLLHDLDKPNEHLSSVWALMPPLSPKADPLFPYLLQLPLEDKKKELKGSRFAKFIADRPEIINGSAQFVKMKRPSTDILPSKL